MNNDTLKPKDESLFSLAAEMGFLVLSNDIPHEGQLSELEAQELAKKNSTSQLT
jgi:hypothetical protein